MPHLSPRVFLASARSGLAAGLLLAGLLAAAPLAQAATIAAECDQPDFQTVLQPSPATDARAYWLNRQWLQWPGQRNDSLLAYRLYHSAQGRIQIDPQGRLSGADGAIALQSTSTLPPKALQQRFRYIGDGLRLTLPSRHQPQLGTLLRGQLLLVAQRLDGTVQDATAIQLAGVLDDRFATAASVTDLGVSVGHQTGFKLWAPTAQQVQLCRYPDGSGKAIASEPLQPDAASGIWSLRKPADLSGQYYSYLVDVFVPGVGLVRNRVTDPYSVSLTTDSRRSYIANLASPSLKPPQWDSTPAPSTVKRQTDMTVYELHVRDFSLSDASVSPSHRGKYLAFTEPNSNGMRHLTALARAGLTDVHLLPVFDFATVPEQGCVSPKVPAAAADSEAQQAAVMAHAADDCFNWGYDPFHYSAPEGSYASDAADGAKRVVEFRQMVQALHRAGLRVGMDVVYNHTSAAGQQAQSVLDRIVPGYYQRLDAKGKVERSTCCDNTATENRMMAKLMIDSVALWTREYRIDSFRFDLMGHQPRAAMAALQRRVNKVAGKPVQLIGEGWNFGEIANGARFVQASQLSLNGSGIGTFSDRARDAVRGGSAGDGDINLIRRQGYINGLVYDPNAESGATAPDALLKAADLVRVGLAGSLRSYRLQTWDGSIKPLAGIDYAGQPAGYVSQPGEVVNYVENHDNQTLWDNNAYKLPLATNSRDRARVQLLGLATTALSQGVAYFHAGVDILRSKSMDRNSYDSGDWFNRLDWSYQDNGFGAGLPPKQDNGAQYGWLAPRLANPDLKPTPADIAFARDGFRDLLRIRASSSLFRLDSAKEITQRLRFYNTGPQQDPTVIAARLDGRGRSNQPYKAILYFINVAPTSKTLTLAAEQGQPWRLHPVQQAADAADSRPREEARYQPENGRFSLPPRSTVVYVME